MLCLTVDLQLWIDCMWCYMNAWRNICYENFCRLYMKCECFGFSKNFDHHCACICWLHIALKVAIWRCLLPVCSLCADHCFLIQLHHLHLTSVHLLCDLPCGFCLIRDTKQHLFKRGFNSNDVVKFNWKM